MDLKNVLVVAYYYPPMGLSGVQRTLKFVKYLPLYGWRPIVLTTTPAAYYAFDETLDSDLNPEDVIVYRTPPDLTRLAASSKNNTIKYPSYFSQKARRIFLQTIFQPDSRITWKKSALATAEKIFADHKIDAIFTTAPPFTDFLIAGELSKRYNKSFVMDYRDLWVDNAFYFYATPFHKMYSIKLESELLLHAKRAIVTTRNMKEMLIRRYKFLTHDDVTIIPHGYDPEDFAGTEDIKPNPEKFTITHSGLFPDDLTPKYFLKALALFLDKNSEAKKHLEARFIGIMKKNHQKLIKKYDLEKYTVQTGYISHKEAIRNLLESDVLWLMITNNIATPSRLYEYFGAGKPILVCAPDGNISRAALDTKAALAALPKDVESIEKAIGNFYKLWKHRNLPIPDKDYTKHFDRKILSSELAREISFAADFF